MISKRLGGVRKIVEIDSANFEPGFFIGGNRNSRDDRVGMSILVDGAPS